MLLLDRDSGAGDREILYYRMTEVTATQVRILLVDDHALFREGVARLLEAEPDFAMAATCAASFTSRPHRT